MLMNDLFASAFVIMAEFSPCRTWRYVLRRRWDASLPMAAFVLLNPSVADETQDDPTICRCIGYAKRWGYGGLVLGNLFALRSTDPRALRTHSEPVGAGNDAALIRIAHEGGGAVICGWGTHGAYMERGAWVSGMLRNMGYKLKTLKLTAAGHPSHPLYLRGDLQPVEF